MQTRNALPRLKSKSGAFAALDWRGDAQPGLNGLGRFKAQVFAQPAAGDQHPIGQRCSPVLTLGM